MALWSVDLFLNSGVATCSPIREFSSVALAPLRDCGPGRELQDDRYKRSSRRLLGFPALSCDSPLLSPLVTAWMRRKRSLTIHNRDTLWSSAVPNPKGFDNLQSVPRRALMGQAWHHPHAQEARPLVGPLFTAQPRRVARRGACHLLYPVPQRRLQAHGRCQARHPASGSPVVAHRPQSLLHGLRSARRHEHRAQLA